MAGAVGRGNGRSLAAKPPDRSSVAGEGRAFKRIPPAPDPAAGAPESGLGRRGRCTLASGMDRRRILQAALGTLPGAALVRRATAEAAESTRPVRIGQIGVGHAHAEGKMLAYRESARFEVVGIAEPDDALWAEASGRAAYRGLRRFGVDELLAAPGLEAVAVESRVRDLLGHAHAAVAAGMHIHLDKPPGDSLEEFRRLMAAAGAAGRIVQLGYMYRYNPAVRMLRGFLDRGWLGELTEVHAVMGKVLGTGERAEVAEFRGGIMFELGCHVIDLVVDLLGRPDRVSPHIRATGGDGLADSMLAVLDYPKAVATVRASAVEVEGFARRHLVACGTGGTFHIQPLDRPRAWIALSEPREDGGLRLPAGVSELPFEPPYRRYVGDAADFAAVIRGEGDFRWPAAHDIAVQETVLRASGMM